VSTTFRGDQWYRRVLLTLLICVDSAETASPICHTGLYTLSGQSLSALSCFSTIGSGLTSGSSELIAFTYSGYSTSIPLPIIVDDNGLVTSQHIFQPATTSATTQTSGSPVTSRQISIGAIVGIVIGIIALVVAVLVTFMLLRRRKHLTTSAVRPRPGTPILLNHKPELDASQVVPVDHPSLRQYELVEMSRPGELSGVRDPAELPGR
jgi:hypothetical protein